MNQSLIDSTYAALETAIQNHVAAVDGQGVVVEWLLPIVTMDPSEPAGTARHLSVSSGMPLHNRAGILIYHLRNAEHQMINAESDEE